VILVDANLLIYAVNRDLAQHGAARRWVEAVFSGNELVGIPWVALLAFLRVCTSSRVFERPLSPEAAVAYVDDWLAQPVVRAVGPGERHWAILRSLLEQSGTAGNLTTDAHIAALALEHGCVICSADNDFKRFPVLKRVNPLAR